MISWEELFKNKHIVFHCVTEDVANVILRIAHNYGYQWGHGNSFLYVNHWVFYEENTCYKIQEGMFGTKSHFENEGYVIIDVKELLSDRIDLNELLEGRRKFKLFRK